MGLSQTDVAIIKELAMNITSSGKELNLWEILSSVNSTVRGNPDSKLAVLMARFYHNYIKEDLPGQLCLVLCHYTIYNFININIYILLM